GTGLAYGLGPLIKMPVESRRRALQRSGDPNGPRDIPRRASRSWRHRHPAPRTNPPDAVAQILRSLSDAQLYGAWLLRVIGGHELRWSSWRFPARTNREHGTQ